MQFHRLDFALLTLLGFILLPQTCAQGWSPSQKTPEVGIPLGNEGIQGRVVKVVSDTLVSESDARGYDALAKKQSEDRFFFNLGVDTTQLGSSTNLHSKSISSKKQAIEVGESGLVFTSATQNVAKGINLSPVQGRSLATLGKKFPKPKFRCPYQIPRCNPTYPYRNADGSCNNLRYPLWGKAVTPLQRFIAPRYQDGVSSPRELNLFGFQLPSSRKVSTIVHSGNPPKSGNKKFSHMIMQFGQFLDHDITSTPFEKGFQGSDIICCEDLLPEAVRRRLTVDLRTRSACFPINVPPRDHYYNNTCMNFVRSIQAPNSDCNFGYREQLNQITAYIDASNVYGSSIAEQWALRTGWQGKLQTSDNQLLPRNDNAGCLLRSRREYCFRAGDGRVNEQMGLASLHTIFMREHNKIAAGLARANSRWNDEKIFQETKKIMSAIMQHISYSEWLPLILNKDYMNGLGLTPKTNGFSDTYDSVVDASIRNSFATAAFRFGHSLVRNKFRTMKSFSISTARAPTTPLTDMFGRPHALFDPPTSGVGNMVRGLLVDQIQDADRYISKQLTNHLFEDPRGHSLDLAALNIQRGRDHGIPPYNVWRVWCGLPRSTSFSTGRGGLVDHNRDSARALQQVYASPDDIDLFTGAVSEKLINGGLVGPTFACIISRQFKLLMVGDRFWYERGDRNTGFTAGDGHIHAKYFAIRVSSALDEEPDQSFVPQSQLQEIRKVKLSKIICRNTGINSIQPNAFLRSGKNKNKKKPCENIGYLDIGKWSNCQQGGWGPWSPWNSCRTNQQWRYRLCNNPPPSAGCTCSGQSLESRSCYACTWNWYTGRCE